MNKELKEKIENTMYKNEDSHLLEEEISKLKDYMKKAKDDIMRKE